MGPPVGHECSVGLGNSHRESHGAASSLHLPMHEMLDRLWITMGPSPGFSRLPRYHNHSAHAACKQVVEKRPRYIDKL